MKTITTKRRISSILIAVVMVLGIFAVLPQPVSAAIGMATINISNLSTTNDNNGGAVATQSQWSYNGASKILTLNTPNGNYTIKGSNKALGVTFGIDASNSNVTLDHVTMMGTGTCDPLYVTQECKVTLVGSNTLLCYQGNLSGMTVKRACIITGTGSLKAETTPDPFAASNGISITTSGRLSIEGAASVTAVAPTGRPAISGGSATAPIMMSDNASLTMVNQSGAPEVHSFQKSDSANTHMWKLTDATPLGFLTDPAMTVRVENNATGTVAREKIPLPPKTSISKITAGKKQMKVTWKKVSATENITNYELRYRIKGTSKWTTKTYPASKSSATIKSLKKGKVYQVQVCSYKVLGAEKYYSPWSATKTGKKIK